MSAALLDTTAAERAFARSGSPLQPLSPAARGGEAPASTARASVLPAPTAAAAGGAPASHPTTPPPGAGAPGTETATHRTGGLSAAHPHLATHRRRMARPTPSQESHDAVHPVPVADRLAARVPARPALATGPRARLVRAAQPAHAPQATGPFHTLAPTLPERLAVLRVTDRSPVLDAADEDRGAVPEHDPGVLAGRIALATVEVLAGRRPLAQLARWLTPGVLEALQVRAALTVRVRGVTRRAPQVRRVRACSVDEHTVEAGVVVEDGGVVRAVALRLETHRGAWRATVLEVG